MIKPRYAINRDGTVDYINERIVVKENDNTNKNSCADCERVNGLLKRIKYLDYSIWRSPCWEVTAYLKRKGKYYVEVALSDKRRLLAEMPEQHYRALESHLGGDIN